MELEFLRTYSIALKLRTLRNQKHLTLAKLGKETGFSTALLSKLESGKMVPTLPTLAKISRVYGIGLSHFFSDVEEQSVAITRKAHVQLGDVRSRSSVNSIPLHMPQRETHLMVSIFEYTPGAISTFGEQGQRNETAIYVIEGQLELTVAGQKEVLEEGDCAVLNTSSLVISSTREGHLCRVLVVQSK